MCVNHCTSIQTQTLASWTDYTKTRQQWAHTFSGLQIAKELDLLQDIVPVIITILNSVYCLHKAYERDGEGANEVLRQLIDLAMCFDRMS